MRKTKNPLRVRATGLFISTLGGFGLLFGHAISISPDSANAAGVCSNLESQLSQAMRGSGNNRHTRKYDRAIAEQNKAMKQTERMARQRGCSNGVTRFGGECRAINSSLKKMRANLNTLERSRNRAGGGGSRDNRQVRRVLAALEANGCRGGSRQARQRKKPGGLFALFNREIPRRERGVNVTRVQPRRSQGASQPGYGGKYRTVCVRKCDGFFFPVSFSTSVGKFKEDANQCASMGNGAETELYVFRMPYETLEDAVSLTGASYMSSPNALRFQTEFVEGCSNRDGQAGSMLEAVRDEKTKAETRVASEAGLLSSGTIDKPMLTSDEARDQQMAKAWLRKRIARPPRPEEYATVDPTTLREAKSGIRDVSEQPNVNKDEIPVRFVINATTYPPLPIRRPDPLDGRQLSAVQ